MRKVPIFKLFKMSVQIDLNFLNTLQTSTNKLHVKNVFYYTVYYYLAPLTQNLETVSYTHLDVYKRQFLKSSGPPPPSVISVTEGGTFYQRIVLIR